MKYLFFLSAVLTQAALLAADNDHSEGEAKDTMSVQYRNSNSYPDHGVTVVEALEAVGVKFEQIDYLRLLGDENAGTRGMRRDVKIDELFWNRYFRTAEPYKYWVPSGNRVIEIYVKGRDTPLARLLVNETDRTVVEGDPRKLGYISNGLHEWFMRNLQDAAPGKR